MAVQNIPSVTDVTALGTFVQQKESTPFLWGYNDCCSFAADWVALATGRDVMEELRGLTSAKDAFRALALEGGIHQAVSKRLGSAIPPMSAGAGDVVLVSTGKRERTLAVCLGNRLIAPGLDGAVFMPLTAGVAAWHVS